MLAIATVQLPAPVFDAALDNGGPVPADRHPDRHQVNGTPVIRPTVTARRRLQFGPELVAVGAGVDCRLSRFRAESLRSSSGRGTHRAAAGEMR